MSNCCATDLWGQLCKIDAHLLVDEITGPEMGLHLLSAPVLGVLSQWCFLHLISKLLQVVPVAESGANGSDASDACPDCCGVAASVILGQPPAT